MPNCRLDRYANTGSRVGSARAVQEARLAATDPPWTAEQMQQVQRLSTDALRDNGAVVQGCRRTSLHHEIANATRVLGAAGIDARLQVDPAAKTDRLSETSRNHWD